MARDKKKDDMLFNCLQKHEHDYVAGLYPGYEGSVRSLLAKRCGDNTIYHSTHMEVYNLIKKELGLPLPN